MYTCPCSMNAGNLSKCYVLKSQSCSQTSEISNAEQNVSPNLSPTSIFGPDWIKRYVSEQVFCHG